MQFFVLLLFILLLISPNFSYGSRNIYEHNLNKNLNGKHSRSNDNFKKTSLKEDRITNIEQKKNKNEKDELEKNDKHTNETKNDPSDYDDALLEHTANGEYKVIPLSSLNSLNGKEINEQIDTLKTITRRKAKKTQDDLPTVSNCKNHFSNNGCIFERIMQELEDIKHQRTRCGGKEGLPCSINGSWISYVGCSRLEIEFVSSQQMLVTFSETTPPRKDSIFNKQWIGKGDTPFEEGGLFTITAWNPITKQMATFLGQCRFCSFAETISGWWSFGREARDCRDLLSCGNVRADIIRKEVLHRFRDGKNKKSRLRKKGKLKNVKKKLSKQRKS